MNKNRRLIIAILCLTVLIALFASGCASSSNEGDKFIMGGTYRLNNNEKIDGNLSIFGGAVSLEKGSTINGNVTLIGGTVSAAGTINGGINGLGGSITLGDTAVVQGDVTTIGASVNKSDSAIIQGKMVSQSENGVQLPDIPRVVAPAVIKPFGDAMGGLLRALVIALLAVLVVLFIPRQTINVHKAIEDNPVSAGAIGLFTMILFPFVIVILAITIILIPLSLVAILIFGLGIILGWIAIGFELGTRIAGMFKSEWAPAVSAGVGTFVLSILSSLLGAIPCVGWVIPVIIVLVATGGVVISAFGTRYNQKPSGSQTIRIINPTEQPGASTQQAVNFTAASSSDPVVVDTKFAETSEEPTSSPSTESKTTDSTNETEKKTKTRTRKPKSESDSTEIHS
jgi:hypothetical protein